jgi:hypothetical protein
MLPITMAKKPWSLFFVVDRSAFECDYVVAKTAREAERLFSKEYGGLEGKAELVTAIVDPPAWLTESCWLGATPDLTEFGGEGLASVDFPRWKFGDKVFGPPTTKTARYR